MYLGQEPSQSIATVSVQTAKSWVSQEVFWMGFASSLLAGVFVFLVFEWHK